MTDTRKSLLDKFHDLNLQLPIKQTVVNGIFWVAVALIGGFFLVFTTLLNKPETLPTKPISSITSEANTASSAFAQRTRLADPYEFAQAVIESLSWAADARQVMMSSPAENKSAADTLASMTNARIAISKLERANGAFRNFSNSDNEAMKLAVLGFNTAYYQLSQALNESIRYDEKLLSVSNEQELGALLSEASKWVAQADEAWKKLVYATAAASYALIDDKRLVDGKSGYLTITAAERNQLLVDLEHYFGDSVKKGMSVGQHPIEAAPAALWDVLNQPWKPADAS